MKIELKDVKPGIKRSRDTNRNEDLISSMRDLGQLEPIIINQRNEIISGRRRYFAAKELKLQKIEVIYYERSAIDQQLAEIDANILTLPLGDVEYDLALSSRKKLYLQKFPNTRQYAQKGDDKTFTTNAAELIGVTKRSIELAVVRADKASAQLTAARKEGRVNSSVTNLLVRMPAGYQDKLLPLIGGKRLSEVKHLVSVAMDKDIDRAIQLAKRKEQEVAPLDRLVREFTVLEADLGGIIKRKYKYEFSEVKPLIDQAERLVDELEKFIAMNTPLRKPILRKSADNHAA